MIRTLAPHHPEGVTLRLARFGLAIFLIAMPAAHAAEPPAQNTDITLDAASSEVDYRANALLFRDLIITQGSVRVVAQRARSTGLDFEDSTWTLSGAVRIDVDGGTLTSEEAAVTFEKNRIVRASIRGKPAEFAQKLKDGGSARGRAGNILYDMAASTVTLREDAWLSDDGRSEVRGDQLVYNVREQRVQAGKPAGSDERVRIIIRPRPSP